MRYLFATLLLIANTAIKAQTGNFEPQNVCKERIGSLMVERYRIDVGKRYIGEASSDTILCYNPTEKPIEIAIGEAPEGLMARFDTTTIQPKSTANLVVTIYQTDQSKVGYYFETFSLMENGEYILYPYFSYTAKLENNYTKFTTEELANAPKIECDSPTFDFGTINEGAKIKAQFEIKNSGKTDLEIFNISTSCGCTEAKSNLMITAPGMSTKIAVTFDSSNRHGNQYKTITIYSNSPTSPEFQLSISGIVK